MFPESVVSKAFRLPIPFSLFMKWFPKYKKKTKKLKDDQGFSWPFPPKMCILFLMFYFNPRIFQADLIFDPDLKMGVLVKL